MELINAILALIPGFATQYPIVATIVGILGTLVILGQVVVMMTPSKSDDEAYNKIMGIPVLGPLLLAVSKFSVIQKK